MGVSLVYFITPRVASQAAPQPPAWTFITDLTLGATQCPCSGNQPQCAAPEHTSL